MSACEGKCGLSMADANKDGKISKKEFVQRHDDMFTQLDANRDDFVDQTENGQDDARQVRRHEISSSP